MSNKPLVSIGLPTYNRAATLGRAIESALNQDYQNIQLLISDNASTDETEAICLNAAQQDDRVRYLRQQTNQGAIANFREVLSQAGGEFFMWLADDDWLEASYVAACVGILLANPDHMLVCGRARFFDGEQFVFEEAGINLTDDSGANRVLTYYDQVVWNGTFYGVMRREPSRHIPIHETVGADWFFIADVAFTGKVRTLNQASVNRSLKGESSDAPTLAAHFGLRGLVARFPHLKIATSAWKNIVWWSPVYGALNGPARMFLACRVFITIYRRFIFARWYGQALARVCESHPRVKRAAKLIKNRLMAALRSG